MGQPTTQSLSAAEAFLASRFGTMRPRTIGLRVNYDL